MRVRPREVTPWNLDRVAEAFGGTVMGDPVAGSTQIRGLSLSTRDVERGDLFVAMQGSSAHGAHFSGEAIDAGASAVLTDHEGARFVAPGVPLVVAEITRPRLAPVVAQFYGNPARQLTTIGITGTQGKTTSSYLAEAAAGVARSAVVGTIGSRIGGEAIDSALTTPESPALQALFAVMVEEHVEVCAMEVSSHALTLGRVDGFVFDTALFLNLGRDHLDFHTDMDDYFAAKARLFTPAHARSGVVNVDDAWGRRLREESGIPVVSFSTEGRAADWRGINVRSHRSGSELVLLGPAGLELPMTVPLPGVFNVSNAVGVVAALVTAAEVNGEPSDVERLVEQIATSPGVPGRMERVEAGQEYGVVIDYAHKPEAVTAVLSALRPVTAGRLMIVIGAGGDRDHGKRPLMGRAAAELADVLVVTDDNPRRESPAAIRAGVVEGAADGPAEVREIGDRREAIAWALGVARRGDTVVIAGKGHERGQEIAGVVHPFDDRSVAREILAELA